MNKEILQQQIADLEAKLAELKAEVNKPTTPVINHWKPKVGDKFFYVDAWGHCQSAVSKDNLTDRYRIFETQEKAQVYAKYVKAEETLKAEIARLNEGWWPNWENIEQRKYYIYLVDNRLYCSSKFTDKFFPNFMYLASAQLAATLIKTHSKELTTYLSY